MNKKTIIIVAVVALLMLGAGLGGGYYLTTSGMLGGEAAAAPAPPPETVGVLELDPFLTNIGASGKRHARISVKLAISPEERSAEVGADSLAVARLRDLVLTLPARRTFASRSSIKRGRWSSRGR